MAFAPKTPTGMTRYSAAKHAYEIFDGQNWVDYPLSVPVGGIGPVGAPGTFQSSSGANGPSGLAPNIGKIIYNDSQGSIGINNPSHSTMKFTTKKGDISVNLETGELTLPLEVSKDKGLRTFWLAFQEHFKGPDKQKINDLEREILNLKKERLRYTEYVSKEVKEKLTDKILKKYGDRKIIMTKPEELLKLLDDF